MSSNVAELQLLGLMRMDRDLRLYLLVRTDMASMNPGKAIAQGAHAANKFEYDTRRQPDLRPAYEEWSGHTAHGCGTTISLEVDEEQLHGVTEIARRAGFAAGIFVDPTYPLQDGRVVHLLNIATAGYVFGDSDQLAPLLRQFSLHP